jgi:acyl-CoA synthetase (AMP-forming)/AMP-acid ligase II
MTETFGGYWWGVPDPPSAVPLQPGERRPPPLDRLQPGVELKVVDPEGKPVPDGGRGEICIRGASITPGLHKADRSATFDADGWFHTGDEGEVDGVRVRFRGRLGDMIKTAGANVAPPEVVAVLATLPGVAQAFVVGLPDPVRGQVVTAAVVPEPGVELDPVAIRTELHRELATYKVPAHIVVLGEDDIPWTASHKVAKAALAALLAERVAGTGPVV